jgi:hypothetical protein
MKEMMNAECGMMNERLSVVSYPLSVARAASAFEVRRKRPGGEAQTTGNGQPFSSFRA